MKTRMDQSGRKSLWRILRTILGRTLSALIAIVVLALLILIGGLHSPSSHLAAPLYSVTGGNLKLSVPFGSLKSGGGELWVKSQTTREWAPWTPIAWNLDFGWQGGVPEVSLRTNLGTIVAASRGISLVDIETSLPPRLLLMTVKHPLAKAPWRGDVKISIQKLDCDLNWRDPKSVECEGNSFLTWQGMGSSILPLAEFGTYALKITSQRKTQPKFSADVSTLSGAVNLSGTSTLTHHELRIQLRIKGEKSLIGGLDKIAGQEVKKVNDDGEFLIDISKKLSQ